MNRYLTEMLHNEELRETALRGLCVFAKNNDFYRTRIVAEGAVDFLSINFVMKQIWT